MKFSVGDRVTVKLPWHDRLMPEWKRQECRVGHSGEIVNTNQPDPIGVAFMKASPEYDVRFQDGEVKNYPEGYLKLATT